MNRVVILFLALCATATRLLSAEPAVKVAWLDGGAAWVQTASVTANFASELQGQLTNKVSGLVLDLRFASGEDAVSVKNFPMSQKAPIVVLVNAQTRDAAADLAAQLRSEAQAILIGGTNVTGKITPDISVTVTGDWEKKFQADPFAAPDKTNTVATDQELLPFIDHTSEAELVRRRVKDGDDDAADAPRTQPEQPVIRDPALARAVDLLKALAVLNKSRG
jgi:hypothetical protein